MGDANVEDRIALDRDVSRAATALARWRRDVAADPDGNRADPMQGLRHVAAKSTWDALGALSVNALDEPLRTGLRRWTAALIQARLSAEDDVSLAREEGALRARFEGDPPHEISWRAAWRGAVRARTSSEVRRWLAAAAEAATPVADARRIRAERRREVARRLGFAHPWDALVPPAASTALVASARELLDATEDLWRAMSREWLRGTERTDAAEVLHAAVGRDAGEGWPARLAPRWLAEIFGAHVRGLSIDLPPLPEALGASSFVRALGAFGRAVREAMAPRAAPFSVRFDPAFVPAHRHAVLFATLAFDPVFQARGLGLGEARAAAQARRVARIALVDARLDAARMILGADAEPPRELFDEMGERVLGAPLDPRLRGAWPAAQDDQPARWAALLQGPSARRAVRDAFDVDWFRNPKAWANMVAQAAAPAYQPLEEGLLDTGPGAAARAFEGALG
jgi:hypothetical protein